MNTFLVSSIRRNSALRNFGRFSRRFSIKEEQRVPLFVDFPQIEQIAKKHNLTKTKFIDVRAPQDFEQGKIPSAVNIHDIFTFLLPTSHPNDISDMNAFFADKFGEAGIENSDDEYVVVYEAGLNKMYGSSCRGYFFLKHMGHDNVSVLSGGFHKYVDDGHSVCTEPPQAERQSFKAKENPTLVAGRDDILSILNGEKKGHLLDVRDRDEWVGVSSSPYGVDFCPRKGRLEGAKWIEWYDFMNDGIPKSNEEIREMVRSQGIEEEDEIIVYCFKGARASNTLMNLNNAGFKNVKNYVGSWNEWSRDHSLPIDDRVIA